MYTFRGARRERIFNRIAAEPRVYLRVSIRRRGELTTYFPSTCRRVDWRRKMENRKT